ncbi:ATP-binding protein [Streptomyces fradiae]|uniref:ATP-binding protein n=1 Tax=Streptomyces fradiae TaxID=1906 RepID=UPI00366402EC
MPGRLCVEVTDTRGDRAPVRGRLAGEVLGESGYGLLLVGEPADRWGVRQGPVPCKTVWAELDPVAVE